MYCEAGDILKSHDRCFKVHKLYPRARIVQFALYNGKPENWRAIELEESSTFCIILKTDHVKYRYEYQGQLHGQ